QLTLLRLSPPSFPLSSLSLQTARDVINALTCDESSLHRYLPHHQQQQQPSSYASPSSLSTAGMGGSLFRKPKGSSSSSSPPSTVPRPSPAAPLQTLPVAFQSPGALVTRPAGTQVVRVVF
ncbi:unnamed protein product, partial [Closterium sp. NIES-54]